MTRGRLVPIVVLTLAALLLTGGCRLNHTAPKLIRGGHHGHSSTSSAPNDGTVHGQLVLVGGPAPGGREGLPGVVTLTGVVTVRVEAGSAGRWSASVPAGHYRVAGSSPQFQSDNPSDPQLGSPPGPCAGGSVTVVPGRSTQVDVFCSAR